MKHKIHFDTFIDNVILSEPSPEKLSLMQRYDFHNGYGENTLLTHIRILCRTLISESGHTALSFEMFQEIANHYDNITSNDIVLLYKILVQDSKRISFRNLCCFFINLNVSSVKNIMLSLYKSENDSSTCVTYDIDTTPYVFQSLKVDIPDRTEDSISTHIYDSPKTPPPSPVSTHKRIHEVEKKRAKQKIEKKKNMLFSRKRKKSKCHSYWDRFLMWTGCKSNSKNK